MSRQYDVIVLGLGAMGSAAAYHLARRGLRVLGLDRFRPPHDRGSSHGRSRIIRQSYFEDPAYVPLVRSSYELWEALGHDLGRPLIQTTGCLTLGPEEDPVVAGCLASVEKYDLEHELLDESELRQRYSPLDPEEDTIGILEPGAGVLRPEECIEGHLRLATRLGAELHYNESVESWSDLENGVAVETARGQYEAERLVIAAGSWSEMHFPEPAPPMVPLRKPVFWLQPEDGIEPFLPDRFPAWVWAVPGEEVFYGLPALTGPAGGVKVAIHTGGEECSPDLVDRRVRRSDLTAIQRCLAPRIPSLRGPVVVSSVCFYSQTPDGHFILGIHPELPQVLVAAGFSGHGFKFSGLVGEILADLATTEATEHPISLFDPQRFPAEAGDDDDEDGEDDED